MVKQLRWLSLILAFSLCLMLFPVRAAQITPADTSTMDYVLLVDVSDDDAPGTVFEAACDFVMDLLPYENVRIGMIAYGYAQDTASTYVYSIYGRPAMEWQYVHQLADLEEIPEAAARNLMNNELYAAYEQDGKRTPHGQALLAAVDMLERSGAADGNACMILMSDGRRSSDDWGEVNACKDTALSAAAAHNWPIYTIELNIDGQNKSLKDPVDYAALDSGNVSTNLFPKTFMTEVAYRTGAEKYSEADDGGMVGGVGTWEIALNSGGNNTQNIRESVSEVHDAVMEILGGRIRHEKLDPEGNYSLPLQVDPLTCEYIVGFSGMGLQATSIDTPDKKGVSLDDAIKDGVVEVEKGEQHVVVKLIRPTPGDWRIWVHGNGEEEVTVYEAVATNVNMALSARDQTGQVICNSNAAEPPKLEKNDSISFASSFTYLDRLLQIDSKDGSLEAYLEIQVKGEGDAYRDLPSKKMELTQSECTIVNISPKQLASEASECFQTSTEQYRARVRLERVGAENAAVVGEWYYFSVNDIPISVNKDFIKLEEKPALSTVTIDLNGILDNPDGDPLRFELAGTDDAGEPFLFVDKEGDHVPKLEGNPSQLTVATNAYVGRYTVTLQIWDGEECCAIDLDLPVTNSLPEPEETEIPVVLYNKHIPVIDSLVEIFRDHEMKNEDDVELDESNRQILNVTIMDGYDDSVVTCAYDEDSKSLILQAHTAGETAISLEITDGAYHRDVYGDFVHATYNKTISVTVKPCFPWIFWSVIVLLLVSWALGWLVSKLAERMNDRKCIEGTWDYALYRQNAKEEARISTTGNIIAVDGGTDGKTLRSLMWDARKNAEEAGAPRGHDENGERVAAWNMLNELENDVSNPHRDAIDGIHLKGTYTGKNVMQIVGLSKKNDLVAVKVDGKRRKWRKLNIQSKSTVEFMFTDMVLKNGGTKKETWIFRMQHHEKNNNRVERVSEK